LFKKKPDPMSLTMALVEAHASGNPSTIEQARQGLAPVSTRDILQSLYRFGQILNRANLRPEQVTAIEEELEISAASPEMTAAVQNVGRAILIERSQPALTEAVNTFGPPLLDSTSDQLRQMALTLAAITGSTCRRLEVRFNWA
jgi:hypothetical protein